MNSTSKSKDVLEVYDVQVDLITDQGAQYIVSARVDAMELATPAKYNPPGEAHPEEWMPANCSAVLQVGEGDFAPPKDPKLLLDYIQDCDLDWEVDLYD
jgi:hypothetical protein